MAEYTDNNGNVIEFLLPILGGAGSSTNEIVSEALGSSSKPDYVPSVPGLVKLYNDSSGLQLVKITGPEYDFEGNPTGATVDYGRHLYIAAASPAEILAKTSLGKPIVPGRLAEAIAASETDSDKLNGAANGSDYKELHSTVVTPATMKAAIAANRARTTFNSRTDDRIVTPSDMQYIIKANKSSVGAFTHNTTEDWSIVTPSVMPTALASLARSTFTGLTSSEKSKSVPSVKAVEDFISNKLSSMLSVKVATLSKGQEFALPRSTIAAIFPSAAVLSGRVFNSPAGFVDHDITLNEIALVYTTDYINLPTAETRVALVYGAEGTLGIPTLKSYHQLYETGATVKCTSGTTYVYYMSKYA